MKLIEDKLTELYELWTRDQGLPLMSSDELLYGGEETKPVTLTDRQRRWLTAFEQLWDSTGSTWNERHPAGLPARIRARWKDEDWDEKTMTANHYTYCEIDDMGFDGKQVELTEEQTKLYDWGHTDEYYDANGRLTGGSQTGFLGPGTRP